MTQGVFRAGECVLLLLLLTHIAAADAGADNPFGVGVSVGTLGIGVEGKWRPIPRFELRVGANAYDYDDFGTLAGIIYDATINLDTVYATANFHFQDSPYRLTVGAFSNGNELDLVSQNSSSFDIGGDFYTGAEVGTLTSVTSFASTSPYLGVGFDIPVRGAVELNFNFGLLWQGEPEVTLKADGSLSGDPGFLVSLDNERQELLDEVKNTKAWPVISLGFVFNF